MMRIFFMPALLLCVMAPGAVSQSRGKTPAAPPRVTETPQQAIETRQREWSQANAVLLEASRRLPCSPRLTSLLSDVRESAVALAQANLRYFRQLSANEQREIEADQKFASETSAELEELQAAANELEREQQFVTAKRNEAGSAGAAEITAAVEKIEAALPDGDGFASLKESAGVARQMRESLASKEALLRQLETSAAAELKLWDAYYNGIEAGIRKQCSESQGGGAKASPARKRKR